MLGQKMKRFRFENELSQNDLAKMLGVAQNSVSQWERGRRFPSVRKLRGIASVLECPVVELLGDADDFADIGNVSLEGGTADDRM